MRQHRRKQKCLHELRIAAGDLHSLQVAQIDVDTVQLVRFKGAILDHDLDDKWLAHPRRGGGIDGDRRRIVLSGDDGIVGEEKKGGRAHKTDAKTEGDEAGDEGDDQPAVWAPL